MLVFVCKDCGHRMTAGDEEAGLSVECPKCQAVVEIPIKSQSPVTRAKDTAPTPQQAVAAATVAASTLVYPPFWYVFRVTYMVLVSAALINLVFALIGWVIYQLYQLLMR